MKTYVVKTVLIIIFFKWKNSEFMHLVDAFIERSLEFIIFKNRDFGFEGIILLLHWNNSQILFIQSVKLLNTGFLIQLFEFNLKL